MSNILQIAYTTEGNTDKRFLQNIIEKTFESLLFQSSVEIEIYQPTHVIAKGESFIDKIKAVATNYHYFHVICVHCDSDNPAIDTVLENKINPAFELVEKTYNACNNLVAVIPVQMSEAWMLADIQLFLKEIKTSKTCYELNLPCKTHQVERIANPKLRIEEALRQVQVNIPRRRSKLRIADLYSPLSQKLNIQQLDQLPSFRTFKENARIALAKLNYLHD